MDRQIYDAYLAILHSELVPAMGCTEPIAIALTAAHAAKRLGKRPETVSVSVSGNIIKNVKSVIVPSTGGQRGIKAAVAAGILAAAPERELEVLSALNKELKKDPVKAQLVDMTKLNLAEVTRKKIKRSLREQLGNYDYRRN